jgi:hypothetical protein
VRGQMGSNGGDKFGRDMTPNVSTRRGGPSGRSDAPLALAAVVAVGLLLTIPPVSLDGPSRARESPSALASTLTGAGAPAARTTSRVPGTLGTTAPTSVVDVRALFGRSPPSDLAGDPHLGSPPTSPPVGLEGTARPSLHPFAPSGNVTLGPVTNGLNFTASGSVTPPDVQFASGPTQEVEFVNLYGEIFNLTGASLGSFYLGNFFGTGTDYLSDPKILYDNESGRWFASILHINSAGTAAFSMLAVSNSSDAAGQWTVYSLADVPGDLGDQPILGLSSDLIGIGVNLFTSSTYAGVQFWVINKTSALAGGPLSYRSYGPVGSDYSLHPVDGLSPNGTLYWVQADPTYSDRIDLIEVNGIPPSTPVFTNTSLTVTAISTPPAAPMPGSSNLLDAGDQRVQSAVFRDGTITLVLNDACVPSGDSTFRGCVRFVQIDPGTPSVSQDADYGIAGAYLLYPAVAVAPNGTVLMVYGESSTTVYPSIYVTGRSPADASGMFATPVLLRAGTTAMNSALCSGGSCRYGDYFGAAWSPLGPSAWLAGEFVGGKSAVWETAFAEASYSGAGLTPELRLTASPLLLDPGQATNVTLDFLNSTCVAGSSNYCDVHLPLGSLSTLVRTCASPFTTALATVAFPTPGSYLIGAGGYVAAYATSSCTGSPVLNLTVTPLTITVLPAPRVTLRAQPGFPDDVGVRVTLTATATGGAGGFTFLWSGLPTGCAASIGASLPCTPTAPGVGLVRVSATDTLGSGANATEPFVVDSPPSVTLNGSSSLLETGQSVGYMATAVGGTGNLTYRWTGLPSGCTGGNLSVVVCATENAARLNVSVSVIDALGVTATSNSVATRVIPAPVLSISVAPRPTAVNGLLNVTATISGGLAPFDYAWSGLPRGCAATDGPTVVCRPTESGTFEVSVSIVDGLGAAASAATNVTVAAPPAPSASSIGTTELVEIALAGVAVVVGGIGLGLAARSRRRSRPPV